jgi:serine O-acetyltransferase
MNDSFLQFLYQRHQECPECPSPEAVTDFFGELLGVLFPDFSNRSFDSAPRFELHVLNLKEALHEMLYMRPNREKMQAENKADRFFSVLPEIYHKLQQDIEAMYQGDPAAQSSREVIRSYPGFYAIAAYRVAHELHKLGVKIIPRMITEYAHSRTGIDLHPASTIGNHFCIDHGTGVVIGATTEIGDYVKIYQGVTLGALSVNKEDAAKKRHPTIEDRVVIYAGATILGGQTVIGHDSVVGGNTWLTHSIPPYSKVYYRQERQGLEDEPRDFIAFKTAKK